MTARSQPRPWLSALLFAVLWLAYAASPLRLSLDSKWSIHTALSLLHGGWGDLSHYLPILAGTGFNGIELRHGRLHTIFPVGVSLLAIPFVAAAESIVPDFDLLVRYAVPTGLEGWIAAFYAALAGVLFFRIAWLRTQSLPTSMLATLIFAFGTSMWSTASRVLWQHGPLVAALLAAMLLLLRARERPALVQYAGLALAVAYVIRPTAAIAVVVLSLYVFLAHRAQFIRYLLWAMPVAAPWLAFNWIVFDGLLPPYYMAGRLAGSTTVAEALAGNLMSPARGLFVYSPILVLALPGVVMGLRERADRLLHLALIATALLLWIAVARLPHWWAGHSFGPRFMTDALPFVAYFLLFPLQAVARWQGFRRAAAVLAVALLAAASLLIHYTGAFNRATHHWNAGPRDVDAAPARLWDWRDPMFLRGTFAPLRPRLDGIVPRAEAGDPIVLELDRSVRLADAEAGPVYRQYGWRPPDAGGLRMVSDLGTLFLVLPPAARGQGLELTLTADLGGAVMVAVNGQDLGRWQSGAFRRVIPAAAVGTGRVMELRFQGAGLVLQTLRLSPAGT